MSMLKHTHSPLVVRMTGTCSAAWAEIGQLCTDPATHEEWFRPLGQTEATHIERRKPNGQPLEGMPGDIGEQPERFELAPEGEELLANVQLWANSPQLLDRALIDAKTMDEVADSINAIAPDAAAALRTVALNTRATIAKATRSAS